MSARTAIDPPTVLVVSGLCRYIRNPLYLSVATILIGELLLIRSTEFLGYFLASVVAVNIFVMAYEEPYLRHPCDFR